MVFVVYQILRLSKLCQAVYVVDLPGEQQQQQHQ